MTTVAIPREFIWRRLHSLMGLWIVLFLMEHLFTNSQAALLWGDNAQGFVRAVNFIHNLPYLPVIEIVLLGVPILFHAAWGIVYLFTSKSNALPYGRNRAYTWQRLTSWILLIGILLHVAKFRFLEYPLVASEGVHTTYFVKVHLDNGLYTLADRLGVTLYDSRAIQKEEIELSARQGEERSLKFPDSGVFDAQKEAILVAAQKYQQKKEWVQQLAKRPLSSGEVIAATPQFGTATLLTVRDTFKSPIYVALYTIFVLAACFHAFNGLWTFLITWGIVLKMSAQKAAVKWTYILMALILFLGLAAIWGTYLSI